MTAAERGDSSQQPLGLRARKKLITRATIAATAEQLFEERGFSNVTVAEVADASNVSAKTVFAYFPAKEDLVFAQEFDLLEQLRRRISERHSGESVFDAVSCLIEELVAASEATPEGIGRFWNIVGDVPSLQARLRLMWERYELELAETVAQETESEEASPEHRLVAAMLVMPFRVLTAVDVQDLLNERGERPHGPDAWLRAANRIIGHGLNYQRPSRSP